MKIPFKSIQKTEDRSWSLRLVKEIASGHLDEVEAIVKTLGILDDPRVQVPLTELLLAGNKSKAIRQASSDALSTCTTSDTAEERLSWWKSGDAILMRHAVRMAERTEKSLVVQIASDHSHPFLIDAIKKLEFWEEPAFQQLIIGSLRHGDSEIRAAAARALLWQQPVSAEAALLQLAGDAEEGVAIAALDTLVYCASQEILVTLDHLRSNGPQHLRDAYERAFQYVREEFSSYLEADFADETGQGYLRDWVKPILHLINKEPWQQQEKAGKKMRPKRKKVTEPFDTSVDSIIADLSDFDGKWLEKKLRYYEIQHWEAMSASERARLCDFLCTHPDPTVREIACRASAVWDDSEAMVGLLNDSVFGVRKYAAYHSRFLKTNTSIANRLLDLIHDPDTTNPNTPNTVESYALHALDQETNGLFINLAAHDLRPTIRCAAVSQLSEAKAQPQIDQLIPLLTEPPQNTWALHIAILGSCDAASIPTAIMEHLRTIDNLFLQESIARALAG